MLSSGAFGLAGLCFEGMLVEAMAVTFDDVAGFVWWVVLRGQFIEKIAFQLLACIERRHDFLEIKACQTWIEGESHAIPALLMLTDWPKLHLLDVQKDNRTFVTKVHCLEAGQNRVEGKHPSDVFLDILLFEKRAMLIETTGLKTDLLCETVEIPADSICQTDKRVKLSAEQQEGAAVFVDVASMESAIFVICVLHRNAYHVHLMGHGIFPVRVLEEWIVHVWQEA